MTASAAPLIEVSDLKVHFPIAHERDTVKAVDGVSFAVHQGRTLGIIGESGSGKSTLARVLVGQQAPTAGTIRQRGIDPFALGRAERRRSRRQFQMIFQNPHAALNPRMRILESVREPLDILGEGSRAERTDRAETMLGRVGLSPQLARRYPHELSGGQKQRANIARALTLNPALLVCDEVTAALDVSIQADILNLFLDLQAQLQLTLVFITHNLSVALHMSDQLAVMYLGVFMEFGPAEAIAERSFHPYTKALLSAEPVALPSHLRPPAGPVLQGEVPSPIAPPSGCRFRTRCPIATARCAEAVPEWRQMAAGQWVACHYAGMAGARPEPAAAAGSAGLRREVAHGAR